MEFCQSGNMGIDIVTGCEFELLSLKRVRRTAGRARTTPGSVTRCAR